MNREWQTWAQQNLAKGVSLEEITQILRNNGFSEADIISTLMATNPDLGIEPTIGTTRVDYQKMASPRLVHKIKELGGYKVDDERVQLYVIPNFLPPKLCQELIADVNKCLRPSTITTGEDKYGFRTSRTGDLDVKKSKAAAKLESKISRTLGIRTAWSETCQGQKYIVGQEFKPHTDYFEPGTLEFQNFAGDLGQRTWTFTVYLNNCEQGGATDFPLIGQRFYPKQGQATIWNNLNPNGTVNTWTQHHGMPVEKGEKVIITKWFRDVGPGSPYVSDD
jgi:prolyl 4-hydroxylase